MCCFSRPVEDVSDTKIFARFGSGLNQYLAYSMSLHTRERLAMILPIPVARGSGEDAVKFINLQKYPHFFNDMLQGFPPPRVPGAKSVVAVQPEGQLKVHSIGSFDASFVPTVVDFSRLDDRFRLPGDVWTRLPGYAGFGFAVFKLKRVRGPVHPMAFSFPTAMPQSLFFPTLHIHDGEIHPMEEFDHTLYAQGSRISARDWRESAGIAMQFVKCHLSEGLVSPGHHVYRREIRGISENGDIVLRASKVA